ncbi:MAG TPA: RDD family protein [Puia sp.]|nr:RDD family protein [Puia sp.]
MENNQTPGKFITRTRAVNADGTRIAIQTALLCSLCRLIPFNAFSALGDPSYPWHDRLSRTLVIDEKVTQLPPWS